MSRFLLVVNVDMSQSNKASGVKLARQSGTGPPVCLKSSSWQEFTNGIDGTFPELVGFQLELEQSRSVRDGLQ